MKRTGRMPLLTACFLVLALGAPGLLLAGCPMCAAMAARTAPDCHDHERGGPELHPACCGGEAPAGCCGRMKAPESLPGTEAAAASAAPSPVPLIQAPAIVTSVHETLARPVRVSGDPPLYKGVGLYILLSALLI